MEERDSKARASGSSHVQTNEVEHFKQLRIDARF